MALAYECDICGKLFKPEVNRLNDVTLSYRYITNGDIYRKYTMAACPECMHYFVEYVNKHRTNKNQQIKETNQGGWYKWN